MKAYILTVSVLINGLGHSEFLGIYDSEEKAIEAKNNNIKYHNDQNHYGYNPNCYGINTVTVNETNPVWYEEWEEED